MPVIAGRSPLLRSPQIVGADYSSELVRQHLVLVEDAAEPVPSADIRLRDPFRIGHRLGYRTERCGSSQGSVRPVLAYRSL